MAYGSWLARTSILDDLKANTAAGLWVRTVVSLSTLAEHPLLWPWTCVPEELSSFGPG